MQNLPMGPTTSTARGWLPWDRPNLRTGLGAEDGFIQNEGFVDAFKTRCIWRQRALVAVQKLAPKLLPCAQLRYRHRGANDSRSYQLLPLAKRFCKLPLTQWLCRQHSRRAVGFVGNSIGNTALMCTNTKSGLNRLSAAYLQSSSSSIRVLR
jgi:hypothetical protein